MPIQLSSIRAYEIANGQLMSTSCMIIGKQFNAFGSNIRKFHPAHEYLWFYDTITGWVSDPFRYTINLI